MDNNQFNEQQQSASKALKNKVDGASAGLKQKAAQTALTAAGVPPKLSKAVAGAAMGGANGQKVPGISPVPGLAKKDNLSNKEDENQKSLKNPLSGLGKGNGLGGGALGAASSLLGGDADAAKKIKKAKIFIKLAPYIGGFLGGVLGIIVLIAAIMLPSYLIGERMDEFRNTIVNTGDKLLNLLQGNGFKNSSDIIRDKLIMANKKYTANDCLSINGNDCYDQPFDEGILLSTINYNNILDFDAYTAQEANEIPVYDNQKEDLTDVVVDSDKTWSFYHVQDTLLGGYDFNSVDLNILDRTIYQGLIYNLVDYHFTLVCGDEDDSKFQNITTLLAFSYNKAISTAKGVANQMNPITNGQELLNIVTSYGSFVKQGLSFTEYVSNKSEFQGDQTKQKLFLSLFNLDSPSCSAYQNSSTNDDNNEDVKVTLMYTRYINYENYFKYVSEVIIPTIYFNCDTCKQYTEEEKERITKEAIESIIAQRNAYYDGRKENNVLRYKYDEDGDMKFTLIYSPSYLGGNYVSDVPVGTSGTGWKQGSGSRWADIQIGVGSNTTMAKIGCYVTSIATVMANSGTQLNVDYFDPGTLATELVKNDSFTTSGALKAHNWQSIAPNFKVVSRINCNGWDYSLIEATVSSYISSGYSVVVQVEGGGHFVAVVGAANGEIIISDPAGSKPATTKLSDYENVPGKGRIVSIRVFEG